MTNRYPTPERQPTAEQIERTQHPRLVDRATSWLGWWAPELVALIVLAGLAVTTPTTVVTAPAAVLLGVHIVASPWTYRARQWAQDRLAARRAAARARAEADRRAADRRQARLKDAPAEVDRDEWGVAG